MPGWTITLPQTPPGPDGQETFVAHLLLGFTREDLAGTEAARTLADPVAVDALLDPANYAALTAWVRVLLAEALAAPVEAAEVNGEPVTIPAPAEIAAWADDGGPCPEEGE